MTKAIDDLSSLPGKKVSDHEDVPIGKVKEVYAQGGDGEAAWVTIEARVGMGSKRTIFIPLARLKDEDGELRVPYSKAHIEGTPEVQSPDEISTEDERKLRDHFGIDTGDQEMREDNDSYATLVPEGEGTAQRVEDLDSLEAPNADKRDEETKKRLEDPGSAEAREIDAGAIADENAGNSSRGKADQGDQETDRAADHESKGDGDGERETRRKEGSGGTTGKEDKR